MTRKCGDCKWYVDQPRAIFNDALGSCVVPTPIWIFTAGGLVNADDDASNCKCFEPKEGEDNE